MTVLVGIERHQVAWTGVTGLDEPIKVFHLTKGDEELVVDRNVDPLVSPSGVAESTKGPLKVCSTHIVRNHRKKFSLYPQNQTTRLFDLGR